MVTFRPPGDEHFELGDITGEKPGVKRDDSGAREKQQDRDAGSDGENGPHGTGERKGRSRVRPRPLNRQSRRQNTGNEDSSPEAEGGKQAGKEPVVKIGNMQVSADLDENVDFLKKVFHYPTNGDVVFREFSIGLNPPVRAAAVFLEGMTDKALQNDSVLQPLMLLSRLRWEDVKDESRLEVVHRKLIPGNEVEAVELMRKAIDGVLSGDTVVFVDGVEKGLVVETKGWDRRSVEQPGIERVVRGPHESFNETFRTNTALIRKAFHSPDLITEIVKVGNKDRINCGLLYLQGVVNPKLVKEARRRIKLIKTDYIGSSGLLEQFMEDNSFALAPQVLSTERPDRVVNNLIEGKVAVMLAGSPQVLVFPMTFFNILQTAEDAYLRWPYGSLLRIIRAVGIFLALLLPGFYIAVSAHHHEMIPTDLLLAIAGSREQVPFPTVVEVLIMEFSFELIREAGIRIPGMIGTTLGIVGALILGQAAVAAKIVSPILIVVVAVTAIGSFAIPDPNLTLSIRFTRFVYIILGAVMGIFGLVLGFFIHLNHLANLKSFEVPFLSPLGGPRGAGADVFWRKPAWKQEVRPDYLDPVQKKFQPKISRHWLNRGKGGDSSDNE